MIGDIDGTLLLVILVLYFVPTAVAVARRHRNALGIFLLNLFLGGTGVAWVIALVWAVYRGPTGPRA